MNDHLEEVPEQHFSLKQRVILATAPRIAWMGFRALCAGSPIEIRGREHFDRLAAEGRLALGGFWHECIGLMAVSHRGSHYYTLTSYSFDGELAARTARCFGFRSIRGSSSRGGVKALEKIAQATRETDGIAYTLDGPKGPRRQAKPGIGYVATTTRLPVLPIACAASGAWRLNSWDRFVIPKFRSRIVCIYGPPIEPPADVSAESARAMANEITESLNALHRELEAELGVDPELKSETTA